MLKMLSALNRKVHRFKSAEGIKALNAKIDQWKEMVEEVHRLEVSEPQIAGNFFSCQMLFDLTRKGMGRRGTGEQIAVYEVKDGKIVKEHFFYSM